MKSNKGYRHLDVIISYMLNYARLIKVIRDRLFVTQSELAQMIGVFFATINRWENGHHEPTIKVKRKIRELCKKAKISQHEAMAI